LLLVLAFVFGGSGCGRNEVTSTPTPTPTSTPMPTVRLTPTPVTTSAALFLEITQPLDGAQVYTSAILVSGKTIPDAVVSALINDNIVIPYIDQSGDFTFTANLEEGPNYIEVVASDQQGNQKTYTVGVFYIP